MGFLDWLLGKSTPEIPAPARPGGHDDNDRDLGVAVADREDAVESEPVTTWWEPEGATLTEQVEPPRPELTTDARALENLLVSHFDGHNLSLPSLLPAAEHVLPLLATSDYKLADVAAALGEDQVVAAAVLRMANSPLYRGINKITSLPPAIGRLGSRILRMLLLHESLRTATFQQQAGLRDLAQKVWRRSLSSACIMRGLSPFTGVDREMAFLIGLLHDIGYVVVLRVTNEYGQSARFGMDVDQETFEYLCYESHQEFGELVADAWSLPPELKEVIADHHRYPDPQGSQYIMQLQVQLTDMINALLGYAPYIPYHLLESRPVKDLNLSTSAKFIVFLQELPDQVEELLCSL